LHVLITSCYAVGSFPPIPAPHPRPHRRSSRPPQKGLAVGRRPAGGRPPSSGEGQPHPVRIDAPQVIVARKTPDQAGGGSRGPGGACAAPTFAPRVRETPGFWLLPRVSTFILRENRPLSSPINRCRYTTPQNICYGLCFNMQNGLTVSTFLFQRVTPRVLPPSSPRGIRARTAAVVAPPRKVWPLVVGQQGWPRRSGGVDRPHPARLESSR